MRDARIFWIWNQPCVDLTREREALFTKWNLLNTLELTSHQNGGSNIFNTRYGNLRKKWWQNVINACAIHNGFNILNCAAMTPYQCHLNAKSTVRQLVCRLEITVIENHTTRMGYHKMGLTGPAASGPTTKIRWAQMNRKLCKTENYKDFMIFYKTIIFKIGNLML